MPVEHAARVEDEIAHGFGMAAMVGGALIGLAAGVAVVGATALTGGLAAVAIAGAVAGGGRRAGGWPDPVRPEHHLRPAGADHRHAGNRIAERVDQRAGGDPCRTVQRIELLGLPFNHPWWPTTVTVKEGSATVRINGQPASRLKSKLMCGAHIKTASPDVRIGGETEQTGFIFGLEAWTKTGLEILGIGALVGRGCWRWRPASPRPRRSSASARWAMRGWRAWAGSATHSAPATATCCRAWWAWGWWSPVRSWRVKGIAGDRNRITRLSNEGRIDEARAVLQRHVDTGDVNAVVRRLDVSTGGKPGFLWSGNKVAAGQYAKAHGGTTLEGTPGGRVIDDWNHLNNALPWDKGGEQLWGQTSARYTRGLTGNVEALQSPSKAGGGYIFREYELPEIEAGKVAGRITGFEEKIVLPDTGNWP